MLLRPLTAGKVSGTDTVTLTHGHVLGGIVISTDGTNAAAVVLRRTNGSGTIIFDISTKTPMAVFMPIEAEEVVHYSISGTGATAMLYEGIP